MRPSLLNSSFDLPQPAQICGYDVPAGCAVGLCPCAVDISKAVYGEDAEEFRPERWLFILDYEVLGSSFTLY
jgi:cytochrome P450